MSYFQYQIERSVDFFLKFIDDSILDYNIMQDETRLKDMLTEYENLSNDEKNNISEARPKSHPYEEEFQKLCFMLGDFTVLKNKSLYFHIDEDYASSKQFTDDLAHIAEGAHSLIVSKIYKDYSSSHSNDYQTKLNALFNNIFTLSLTFNLALSTKEEIDPTSFPRRRETPDHRDEDFTGGSLYEKYVEVYPLIKKVDSNNIIESLLNNTFISISDLLNMGITYNGVNRINCIASWFEFFLSANALYLHNLSCLFQCYVNESNLFTIRNLFDSSNNYQQYVEAYFEFATNTKISVMYTADPLGSSLEDVETFEEPYESNVHFRKMINETTYTCLFGNVDIAFIVSIDSMIIFELDVNVKPKTVKYEDRVIRFISCTIHHVYAKDYNFALIIAAFVLTRIKGFANEDDRIYTYKKSLLMTETENNDINKFRYDLVQELWKDKFSMFNKKDNAYVHNKWDDLKISSKNFKFLTTFSQFEDLDPNDFEDIQELGEEFGGFSRMFRVRHTGANNTMVLRVYDINYCKRVQGDTADIEFRVSLSKLIECFCRAVRAYVHVGNGPTGKYARYNLRSHRFPYIPILYKCGSIKFDDLSNVSGFYCLEEDFENFMLESRRRKGKIVQLADESLDKLHEVGLVIGSLDKSNIIYDGSKIIFNDLSFAGILESSSRDDDQDEDEDIVRRGSYSLYDEASYIYEAIEQIFSEA